MQPLPAQFCRGSPIVLTRLALHQRFGQLAPVKVHSLPGVTRLHDKMGPGRHIQNLT
jgi:hypothetical protein